MVIFVANENFYIILYLPHSFQRLAGHGQRSTGVTKKTEDVYCTVTLCSCFQVLDESNQFILYELFYFWFVCVFSFFVHGFHSLGFLYKSESMFALSSYWFYNHNSPVPERKPRTRCLVKTKWKYNWNDVNSYM